MRIALNLPAEKTVNLARAADSAGLFAVADLGINSPVTVTPSLLATKDARVIVKQTLGDVSPIAMAEEVAVLDNLSGGRIALVIDCDVLDVESALEDVTLLQAGLSAKPIRHHGKRWTVPSGLVPNMPDSLMVTPEPTQIQIPIWLMGEAAVEVAAATGLPAVIITPEAAQLNAVVQPATAELLGELEHDRELVRTFFEAGVTHLIVSIPITGDSESFVRDYLARFIQPEVGMVDYPRVMSESTPPMAWPTNNSV